MIPLIKHIPLLALLCSLSCVLNGQLSGSAANSPAARTASQKIMPVNRTYSSYQAEFSNRMSAAGIAANRRETTLNPDRLPTKRSYAMIQQGLMSRYPALQQKSSFNASVFQEKGIMPWQRSFLFYRQQADLKRSRVIAERIQ